jgi:hypothetical protein
LVLGTCMTFAGAVADKVGFGDHGQDLEQQPADGIGRVVDGSAVAELHVPFGEVFDDIRAFGKERPSRSSLVMKGVSPARTTARASHSPFLAPAAQAVVDVDSLWGNPRRASLFCWAARSCSLVKSRHCR